MYHLYTKLPLVNENLEKHRQVREKVNKFWKSIEVLKITKMLIKLLLLLLTKMI